MKSDEQKMKSEKRQFRFARVKFETKQVKNKLAKNKIWTENDVIKQIYIKQCEWTKSNEKT